MQGLPDRTRLLMAASVAPMIWGTTYLVTTEWLPADRPVLAAAARALPAGLLLLALGRARPTGAWWWRALVLGTLNISLFLALLFVAAYRLPGGVAATLGAVQPLLVAGFSFVVLGERLRARTLVAGVLGVAGVGLLVLRATARLDVVGVLAGLGAAVAAALGVVLMRRWGRPVGLVPFTGWQLVAGGLVLLPVLLVTEGLPAHLTPGEAGGLAHMAVVGTAIPYLLWFRGMDRLPPTDISFLGLLSPVVAAGAGWVVLGQALNGWQLLGATTALVGLAVAQRPGRGSTPTAATRRPRLPWRSRGPALRPVVAPAASPAPTPCA